MYIPCYKFSIKKSKLITVGKCIIIAPELCNIYSYYIHTGYDRVLSNLVAITKALKLIPGARVELTQLYQQNKWLDITDKPSTDELVTLALGRIKEDPNQYDLFVAMLHSITGMENIANKITSGETH